MRKLVGCHGTTKGKCPTSLIIQLLCIGVLIYLLYGHPYATIEDLCLFGERCSFTGWGYKNNVKDKEYKDEPQDVTSIVLQACDQQATYPAVINIKSIKRVPTTATGISKVENLKVAQDGKCFNLAGQQVGKNYKGIVIKNGKKMVIK